MLTVNCILPNYHTASIWLQPLDDWIRRCYAQLDPHSTNNTFELLTWQFPWFPCLSLFLTSFVGGSSYVHYMFSVHLFHFVFASEVNFVFASEVNFLRLVYPYSLLLASTFMKTSQNTFCLLASTFMKTSLIRLKRFHRLYIRLYTHLGFDRHSTNNTCFQLLTWQFPCKSLFLTFFLTVPLQVPLSHFFRRE